MGFLPPQAALGGNDPARPLRRGRLVILPRARLLPALVALAGLLPSCSFARGYAEGRSAQMVDVEHQYKERTSRGMARFVFIFPATIENWAAEMPPPSFDKPLGIVSGPVTRPFPRVEVELANLSCAACHAGVLYDRDGLPQRRVWLGLPNTSINFEAYSQAAYRALKEARRSKGALLGAIRQLFPEVSAIEMRTIERYVLPSLDRRLMELEGSTDTPAPFNNGGPGLTNGIGSLKRQLRLLAAETFSDEVPFVSIPDLGGVLLRSSFLADGAYAPPGHPRFARVTTEDLEPERTSRAARVIGFFTVPAMGMEPRAALRA